MSYKLHLDHNTDLDYMSVKKKVLKNEPLIVPMSLKQIDFGLEKTVKIDGHIMPTTDLAYDRLLGGVMGISSSFRKRLAEVATPKQERELISILKNGIAAKGNEIINVVCDPVKRIVHGFYSKKVPIFTNEKMFNFFEMIMNRYPSLKLRDMYLNNNEITLNVRSSEAVSFMKDEEFSGGLSFNNDPYTGIGTNITNTILRIVCENGMIGYGSDHINLLKSGTTEGIQNMFEKIESMKKINFLGSNFENTLKKATYLPASVAELVKMSNTLLRFSNADESTISNYMHHSEVRKFLAKKGIEMSKLTAGQAANCPTNIPVWDVINLATHFGSHDYGFGAHRRGIQLEAGKLFGKPKYDAVNFIHLN